MPARLPVAAPEQYVLWPDLCVCCCHPPAGLYRVHVRGAGAVTAPHLPPAPLPAPTCRRCTLYRRVVSAAFWLAAVGAAVVLLPGVSKSAAPTAARPLWFSAMTLFLAAGVTHLIAALLRKRPCSALHGAVEYLGWDGVRNTFRRRNADYADEFVRLNGGSFCETAGRAAGG